MIVLTDSREVRKAAAFVEAIAGVERDFGFRLAVGHQRDVERAGFDPVTFGPDDRYAIVRVSALENVPGSLGLALTDG